MVIRGRRDDPMRNWEPDAGASVFGAYGLKNPLVLYLLRTAPELLSLTPDQLYGRVRVRPPDCRLCQRPMAFRLDGWVCYRHAEPVRLAFDYEPQAARVSGRRDILADLGRELDIIYASGRWHVVDMEMPAGPPVRRRPFRQAGAAPPAMKEPPDGEHRPGRPRKATRRRT